MATVAQEAQLEAAINRGDVDSIVALVEATPELSSGLDAQRLINRIVLPRERARLNAELARVGRATERSLEANKARNADLMARLGYANSGVGRGMEQVLSTAAARKLAGQRAQTAAEFQRRVNNPARFADLQRIADATAYGYNKRATEGSAVTTGLGSGLSIVGTALSSNPITAGIGAGLVAGGAATTAGGQLAAAADRQAGIDSSRALRQGAQGANVPDWGAGYAAPASAGADVMAQGAAEELQDWGLAEEDERLRGRQGGFYYGS
tara:strand:+ start:724 stop:1524 length:801 start_codon:yes stop_codon:yes gene_type:complete